MSRGGLIAATLALGSAWAHAQELPEYRCDPVRAGRGEALEADVEARIFAARAQPSHEAVVELETLGRSARTGSYLDGVLAFELAWRHLEAGRSAEATALAREVLSNDYVEGVRVDQMRAVIAQVARDARRWREVIATLLPVVESGCRRVPDTYRYLLAEAYIHQDVREAALVQIDAADPSDDAEGVKWMSAALGLDCAGEPSVSCAVRVLRYAQMPGPSAGLQQLINEQLVTLTRIDRHRPMLEQAQASGLLDDRFRLIPRPPQTLSTLKPLKRVAPTYPREALKRGQQGYVELHITVAPTGEVISAKVVDSSPPGVFESVALKAAFKARFEPATADGVPIETSGRYTVHFKLGK